MLHFIYVVDEPGSKRHAELGALLEGVLRSLAEP